VEIYFNQLFPVALALKQQFLERGQVPMLDHDWKMDMIITPDEVITAPQGGCQDS
jgi:5-formyltetrahydrofolate cyclo-ligase